MKKIFNICAMILMSVMALGISACGDMGNDDGGLAVSPRALTFLGNGGTLSVVVTGEDFTATPSAEWIEIRTEGNIVYVTVGNTEYQRVGNVAIANAADSKVVSIVQRGINDILVSEIELSATDLALSKGAIETLSATVVPNNASFPALTWSSNNEAVATVENGVVSAVGVGAATITVAATDGSNVSASCKVTVKEPDVYVGGRVTDGKLKATLWTNGVEQRLTEQDTFVFDIDIADNGDVYIVGWGLSPQYTPEALLWKNGVQQKLSNNIGIAHDIEIVGDDVYIVGQDYGTNYIYRATLWKNGVMEYAGPDYSDAASVHVVDGEVWVSGYRDLEGFRYAAIWRNGVEEILCNQNENSYPNRSFMNGDDMYVVGVVNAAGTNKATIWKNGVAQTLSDRQSEAASVWVSHSGDVYVGGLTALPGNHLTATLWKNGVEALLTENVSQITAITGLGNDFYMTGYIMEDSMTARATLWKNGVAQTIDEDDSADAYAVFVK